MLREDFTRDCIKGTPLEDHVKEIYITRYKVPRPALFEGLDDPVLIEIHLKKSFPRKLIENTPSDYHFDNDVYAVDLIIGE